MMEAYHLHVWGRSIEIEIKLKIKRVAEKSSKQTTAVAARVGNRGHATEEGQKRKEIAEKTAVSVVGTPRVEREPEEVH